MRRNTRIYNIHLFKSQDYWGYYTGEIMNSFFLSMQKEQRENSHMTPQVSLSLKYQRLLVFLNNTKKVMSMQ